ncbi:MAG: helix-turn-helix domain-containing protein [Geminicoccaceae bacterium]
MTTDFPRNARRALGISQLEFGKLVDVGLRQVQRWERGERMRRLVVEEIWRHVDRKAAEKGMTREEFLAR